MFYPTILTYRLVGFDYSLYLNAVYDDLAVNDLDPDHHPATYIFFFLNTCECLHLVLSSVMICASDFVCI